MDNHLTSERKERADCYSGEQTAQGISILILRKARHEWTYIKPDLAATAGADPRFLTSTTV